MKLHVGQRLQGTGAGGQPGGYVVTEVVAETPWYGLYAGKKIFANFDFAEKRVRETDNKEWLDVFLRTVRYPLLNDPAYVARRRDLARTEVRRLGVRQSNLWPEPLDLLEVENAQDSFAFDDPDPTREPVVVFARPHGKLLGEWLMGVVPGSALLGVLAEVLAFINQAHAEGLLLNGLGPATLLIDRAERVHYLGGDLAVEEDQVQRLDPAAWLRLYPMERYPRGFAPPECFAGRADRRSDLYTWGALAFSLLTGLRPWQVALEQGQSWAHFQEPHFARLAQVLRELPAPMVEAWAEQLGVAPAALLKNWPGPLVGLLRRLLHPDPHRRPATVSDLQAWLLEAPPPPDGPLIAFFEREGQARVYLELAGQEPGLSLIVQRGVGAPPRHVDEGTRLYAGPYATVVEDPQTPLTPEPIFYSAFLERRGVIDPAMTASTELREASPAALRSWAEEAASDEARAAMPAPLALSFAALGPGVVAEALFASASATVRGWAAAGLAPALRGPERARAEALLAKALQDVSSIPRLQAAQVLLEAADPSDDDFALRLFRALGQGDLDDALDALHALTQQGVRSGQLERLQPILEGERPATCPVCHAQLPHRDRADHLRNVHGFVDVAGHLLPRDQAVPRLWDRVFDQSDAQAQDKLLRLFAADLRGYVMALELDLMRRPAFAAAAKKAAPPADVRAGLKPYWSTLRQTGGALDAGRRLLGSVLPLAREVGRETVLPLLAEPYKNGAAKPADLRRDLDKLCPGPDLLEERLTLAGRLAAVGIDADAVEACLAELKLERLVACEACGTKVRLADLEAHLRRAHEVFQFRGLRQSYEATRASMIEAVCSTRPDPAAFKALDELAQDRHPEKAEQHLANWLCHKIRSLPRERRGSVLPTVAQTLAQAPALPRLLLALTRPLKVTELEPVARVLALETAARLPHALPAETLSPLKPLLANKALPRQAREDAAAGLLAALGKEGPRATEILEAYVADSGKLRAIARLQELEKRIGQSPALDALVARLEDQVRMDCPRCGVQHQRQDMIPHLWDRHRLVLEGRRVREPWHQIADWIVDYRLEKDAGVLARCRELALKADPQQGLDRLQRLLLRQGVADHGALQTLLAQARQAGAGLCPSCFGNVPVAADPPLALLALEAEALTGFGYRIALNERGLAPRLEVETPREVVYAGREPGRVLTKRGGLLLVVTPLVLLFFVGMVVALGSRLPLPVILALTGGAALTFGGLNYLLWPQPAPAADRLVDSAWRDLVPVLVEAGWPRDGLQFLAGLCLVSRQAGNAETRAAPLFELHQSWTPFVKDQEALLGPLVALNLLAVHDAGQTGEQDPLVLLADEAARALAGKAPLRAAALMLHEWFAGARKDHVRRRLTALLQARAFSLGLEVKDLLDLGKQHEVWSVAVGLDDLDLLAQRRLLWSLRGSAPWRRWAKTDTAFDLAEAGAERPFALVSGLLILSLDSNVALTSHGIRLGDMVIDDGPHRVDVVRVKGGFEVQAGRHRAFFRDNPNLVADELERWQAFYFREFLPQLARLINHPPSDLGRELRKNNSQPCPGCGRRLVTRAGEVGVLASGE